MKKIIVIALCLLCSATYAQQGIQFYQGSWKQTLAKAKAENKLIFIDLFTSWCGPCKKMASEVFPLKSIGDMFNQRFINYKIDAEKGEGIDIAKSYKVDAYPTYLFVNGDGVLYYTSVGAKPENAFLAEATNALTEFSDPKPLPMWEDEYEAKKNDKNYLLQYLQKRRKLRLENAFIIDQYVRISSKEEILSKELLSNFLKEEGVIGIDGPFFTFLSDHQADVETVLSMPAGSLSSTLDRYASGNLKRAVTNKDVKLMERIVAIKGAASSQHPEWVADETRMSFYLQTENEQELIKVLDRFSKVVVNYDKEKIREVNTRELKKFEDNLAAGLLKNLTPAEIERYRKYYSTAESSYYAYTLRSMAEAAFRAVNEKKVLQLALTWLKLAAEYSTNFSIPEVTAGVLQKLGKKSEALKYQQSAIELWTASKFENEIIAARLKDNLAKMKDNKPTWVVDKAETAVTIK